MDVNEELKFLRKHYVNVSVLIKFYHWFYHYYHKISIKSYVVDVY